MAGLSKALVTYKVYQTMFRVVKESETVDSRQHCFLLQSSGHEPRYLSVETRQELLRIENSWNAAIVTSVIKLGVSIEFYVILGVLRLSGVFPRKFSCYRRRGVHVPFSLKSLSPFISDLGRNLRFKENMPPLISIIH